MDSFSPTPSPSTSQTQSSNSASSNSHQTTPTPAPVAGNSSIHFVASTPSSQFSSSSQQNQSWPSSSSSLDATFFTPPSLTPEEFANYAEWFGLSDPNTNPNMGNSNASWSTLGPSCDMDMESEPQNGFTSSWVDSNQAAQINNSLGDPFYDSWFNPAPVSVNVPNADDVSPSLDHLFNYDSSYQPSTSTSDTPVTYPVSNLRGDFSNEDDNRPWDVPVQDTYLPPSSDWNSSTHTGPSTSTSAFENALVAGMSNLNMSPFGKPLRQTPNYSPLNPSSNTTFQTTRQFVYTPDTPRLPQSERSKGKQKEVQSERSKGKQREIDPMEIEQTPFQRWTAEQALRPAENPEEERKTWGFIVETGNETRGSGSDSSSDDDSSYEDGEIPSPARSRHIAPLPRGRARGVATMSSAGPPMTSSTSSSIPVDSTFGSNAAAAMTVDDTSFPSASPVPNTAQSSGSVPVARASGSTRPTPVASTSRQDPASHPSSFVPSSYASSSSNNTGSVPTTTASTSTHHPASFVRMVEVVDVEDVKELAAIQSRSLPVTMGSLVAENPAFVPPTAPTANPTPTANLTGPTPNPPVPLPTNAPSLAPILGPSSLGVGSNHVSVPTPPAPSASEVGPSSSEASSRHPSTPHPPPPSPESSPEAASFSPLPLPDTPSPYMSPGSLESSVSPQTPSDLSFNNTGVLKTGLNGLGSPTLDGMTQPSEVATHPLAPLPAPVQRSGAVHTSTDLAEAELVMFFAENATPPVPQPVLVDAASIPLPPSPTWPPDPPTASLAVLVDAASIPLPPSPTITPTPVIIVTPPLDEPTASSEKGSAIKSSLSGEPETKNASPVASSSTSSDGASTPPSSPKAKKQKKAKKAPSEPPVTSEKGKGKVKVNTVEPPSVQAVEASSDREEFLRATLRKQKAEKEKQKKQKDGKEASAPVSLSSNNTASTSSAPGTSSSSKVTPCPASTSEATVNTKKASSSAPASSSSNPQPTQRSPPRGGSVSPLLRKATTTAAAQAATTPVTSTSSAPATPSPVIPNVPAAPVFVSQQTPSASGSGQVPFAGQASFATATQQSSNGYPPSANTGGWPMSVGPLPMGQPVQVPSAAWNTQASQSVFDIDTDMQDATAPPPPVYQQVASPPSMDVDMADAPAWGWNPQSQPVFQSQPPTQTFFQTQPQTQSIFQSQPLFQSQPQTQPLFQSQGNAQPEAQAQASNTFFSSPPSYSTAQQQAQQPASKPLPFQTVESVFPPPYVAPTSTRPQEQQPPVVDVPPPYASQPAPLFSVFQQQQPSAWSSFKVVVELPEIQPPRPPPKQIIIEPEYWEEFFHWLETAPEAKRFPAYPFSDTDVPMWMMDLRDQFWALDNDLGLVWKFVCWCSRGTHFVTRLMSSKKYSEGAMLEAFIARGKDWEKYMYTRRHTPDMCGGGCKMTFENATMWPPELLAAFAAEREGNQFDPSLYYAPYNKLLHWMFPSWDFLVVPHAVAGIDSLALGVVDFIVLLVTSKGKPVMLLAIKGDS
ncbi:hypothetical protein BDZ89DRAFT_1128268 [Hymenopellis radicata]|nr:hypothetical protein BDZ89DRAFT_1128268 [Hymenopellis radicata]